MLQRLRVRLAGVLLPVLDVRVEVLWRHCTNLEVHHRVVRAAHFRAATDKCTFTVDRRDLEAVVGVVLLRERHDVALEQELRNPERVDDVGRRQIELDPLARRQHQNGDRRRRSDSLDLVELQVVTHVVATATVGARKLDGLAVVDLTGVRGLEIERVTVADETVVLTTVVECDVAVAELPVPLERGDVDDDLRIVGLLLDVGLHDDREVEEHRDDHERDGRICQLERHVVGGLTRELVLALTRLVAVEGDRPEDQRPDDDAHHECRDDRPAPQVAHVSGLGGHTVRPAEPHRGSSVATRHQQCADAKRRDSSDPLEADPVGHPRRRRGTPYAGPFTVCQFHAFLPARNRRSDVRVASHLTCNDTLGDIEPAGNCHRAAGTEAQPSRHVLRSVDQLAGTFSVGVTSRVEIVFRPR